VWFATRYAAGQKARISQMTEMLGRSLQVRLRLHACRRQDLESSLLGVALRGLDFEPVAEVMGGWLSPFSAAKGRAATDLAIVW
jgi:hypothetical protein